MITCEAGGFVGCIMGPFCTGGSTNMNNTSAEKAGPPLLHSFCLVAATATSEAADSAQALEWAAIKPASGVLAAVQADRIGDIAVGAVATLPEPTPTLQRFWRGVKLHPDDVPLFRRLELGAEFDSLRRQGRSIHEAFGDLMVFAAGAPLICVDEMTANILRRMGRGLIRQAVFSLREVAAIALPTLAAPTLDALTAALTHPATATVAADDAPPAATEAATATDSNADDTSAATLGVSAAPATPQEHREVLQAAARVEQGYRIWRGLEAKLAGLPLPVLTEINFLPGVGLHPIQELLSAAEKQALRHRKLSLHGGAEPIGPGAKQDTLEGLWRDFSGIIDPRKDAADSQRLRGFSMESAAAETLRAEAATARAELDAAIAPVTEAEIREVFAPGGPLSRVFAHYEMRPEQVDMAVAVGRALSDGRHLLVEADTGTGKSLAYLVPAVLFSLRNQTPVVISTHTKTLQAQLMQKDIPVLRKALGAVFKAALLKGRSNYLCLRKFNELLRNAAGQLEPDEYPPMPGVVSWATASADGDVERCGSIDPARDWRLWTKMHTVGADCLGRKCRYYTRCFVFKARGEARNAQVIVANHALVFASLNREQGALPPLQHVIFDEAHGLEDVATDFLSVEFDRLRLIRQLNRFARESQGGGSSRTGGGLLNQLTEGLEKTRSPLPPEVLEQAIGRIELAREALLLCSREAAGFEEALGGLFPPGLPQAGGGRNGYGANSSRRGREFVPEPGDAGAAGSDRRRGNSDSGRERYGAQKLRYSPDRKRETVWEPIHAARDRLIQAIGRVLKPLKMIHEEFELLKVGRFNGAREIEHELKAQLDFLAEIGQDLEFLVRGDNPDYVYWAETSGGARPRLTLQAAPLKIHQMLNEQLWQRCRSAVLTSATLTGEGSFDFVAHRLGLDLLEPGHLETLKLDSSFDYRLQCRILVPAHVSPPDQGAFGEQFKNLVFDAVTASRGRALVLFTSYAALNEAARVLTGPLGEYGIAVLAQGRDGSREQLLTQLQAGPPCVIFGTSSFWEGIDVPGEALSLLIVAKLPFPAFKDPLWEARRETLEEEGRSAFQHLDIPVAVLKLRQGFGRLIRSRLDRGIFILADTRVLSRRYGWSFLQALPRGHEVVGGAEAVYRTVERFFAPAVGVEQSDRPDRNHVEYDEGSEDNETY